MITKTINLEGVKLLTQSQTRPSIQVDIPIDCITSMEKKDEHIREFIKNNINLDFFEDYEGEFETYNENPETSCFYMIFTEKEHYLFTSELDFIHIMETFRQVKTSQGKDEVFKKYFYTNPIKTFIDAYLFFIHILPYSHYAFSKIDFERKKVETVFKCGEEKTSLHYLSAFFNSTEEEIREKYFIAPKISFIMIEPTEEKFPFMNTVQSAYQQLLNENLISIYNDIKTTCDAIDIKIEKESFMIIEKGYLVRTFIGKRDADVFSIQYCFEFQTIDIFYFYYPNRGSIYKGSLITNNKRPAPRHPQPLREVLKPEKLYQSKTIVQHEYLLEFSLFFILELLEQDLKNKYKIDLTIISSSKGASLLLDFTNANKQLFLKEVLDAFKISFKEFYFQYFRLEGKEIELHQFLVMLNQFVEDGNNELNIYCEKILKEREKNVR